MRRKKKSNILADIMNNPNVAKGAFLLITGVFGYHGYEISEKTDKVIDNQSIFLRMDSIEKTRIAQTDIRTAAFRHRSDSAYSTIHDHLDEIMQSNQYIYSLVDSLIKLNLKNQKK